jgi:hypothetical protein
MGDGLVCTQGAIFLTQPTFVIPAKAGIQENKDFLDPVFTGVAFSQQHCAQGVPKMRD